MRFLMKIFSDNGKTESSYAVVEISSASAKKILSVMDYAAGLADDFGRSGEVIVWFDQVRYYADRKRVVDAFLKKEYGDDPEIQTDFHSCALSSPSPLSGLTPVEVGYPKMIIDADEVTFTAREREDILLITGEIAREDIAAVANP